MPLIWERVWRPEQSIYCLCTLLLCGMEEVNEGLATLSEFKDSLGCQPFLLLIVAYENIHTKKSNLFL